MEEVKTRVLRDCPVCPETGRSVDITYHMMKEHCMDVEPPRPLKEIAMRCEECGCECVDTGTIDIRS